MITRDKMETCIALLRGINVSGHRPLKMDALRNMMENLGFDRVRTYVQSGNVVFRSSETDLGFAGEKISAEIESSYGYDVPVIVLSQEKLREVILGNPFRDDVSKDPAYFHVSFLSSPVTDPDIAAIEVKVQEGEAFVISEDHIYLYCPHGYGRTKLNNSFLEQTLKTGTTTRNWKTCNNLLEMTQQT
jgi:uncharacterized protein (DUF1697 family)